MLGNSSSVIRHHTDREGNSYRSAAEAQGQTPTLADDVTRSRLGAGWSFLDYAAPELAIVSGREDPGAAH